MRIATALMVLATGVAFFGPFSALADMLAHLRVQYVLLGTAIAAVGLGAGARMASLAAALMVAVNLVVVAPHLPPGIAGATERDADLTPPQPLTVAAFNVYHANPTPEAVVRWVERTRPDVVVLNEVSAPWDPYLQDLAEAYPHQKVFRACPNLKGCEAAILARMPWRTADAAWLGERGPTMVHARFDWQGQPLTVVTTHLDWPPGLPDVRRRHYQREQTANLVRRLRALDGPVLLAGDMNATPWSAAFARILDGTGLVRAPTGRAGTWPESLWPFGILIDHVLYDPNRLAVGAAAGPDLGSDHRPLIVRVERAAPLVP